MSRRRADDTGRRLKPEDYNEIYEAFLAMLNKLHNYEEDTEEKQAAKPDVLKVVNVDLNIRRNTDAHHTDKFDITDAVVYDKREHLVVRRGQEFTVRIKFNKKYDAKTDDLRLVFKFGKNPKISKGTKVDLFDDDERNGWDAEIKPGTRSDSEKEITIGVTPSKDCAVGKWVLQINTIKKKDNDKPDIYSYAPKEPLLVYILFNPWCKDDDVFMEEEKLLGEYVLNETGKIYRGNSRRISSCAWNFGQFSGNVLDCALYLLDKSGLTDDCRGDPVEICRKISSVVNSFDNSGVLAGNWSGNYEGGTSPIHWTGSVKILEDYYRTKETVCYGQCWVFSGVVTTLCRALGIPVRSVTNFASAHDTDSSMTIDKTYKEGENGGFEIDEYLSSDSVWNFHVWNDVWMARNDLPKGYGGWQAIDATPQEASDGVMCMGPVSLEAVRRGEVYLPYDAKFLFAEVNSDRVTWCIFKDGKTKVTGVVKNAVGKLISTKRAFGRASFREYGISGDLDREDLTDLYKYREGTPENEAAVQRANKFSSRKNIYDTGPKDVEFEICCHDDAYIGQPLKVELKMTNTSNAKRSVSGSIRVSGMFYTGVINKKSKVCEERKDCTLNGNETKCFGIEIPWSNYKDKMLDHCMFQAGFMFFVGETKQHFTDTNDMRLRKYHPTIQAPDKGIVGKKFQGTVSFVNHLPEPMTNCKLTIEGPGLQTPITVKQKDLAAGEKFEYCFEMTPVKPGEKDIIVNWDCKQVEGMDEIMGMTITK